MFNRKIRLSLGLFSLTILISGVTLFRFFNSHIKEVFSASTHVVISQIQAAGAGSGHTGEEFIELFNPTNSNVDLTGWRLKEENSTNTSSSNLIASMSGSILSHKYFLIGSPTFSNLTPDETYSATSSSFTASSTIILFSDAGTTVVDKVGMGAAVENEASPAAAPTPGGSIQRKIDDSGGHGTDTDNNSADFEALGVSDPRNSSSAIASPNVSPTGSPSSLETPSPTETPSPSTSPANSPVESPSASPSQSPSQNPSPSAVTSPIATPSPTSTPSTTPTPSGKPVVINTPFFTCKLSFVIVNRSFFKLIFPVLTCTNKNFNL